MRNGIAIWGLLVGLVAMAAPEYPPLDSPQNAVRTYYLSLANGDKATFKSCIHASVEHVEAISGMAEMSQAIVEYQKELEKLDSAAAKDASPGRLMGYTAFLSEVEEMNVDIDGDIAISVSKYGPPVQFRKVDGAWKLDLSSVEAIGASQLQAETIKLAVPKVRKHLELVLTMLKEERITAKEANGSLGLKINQIMARSAREAQLALQKQRADAAKKPKP